MSSYIIGQNIDFITEGHPDMSKHIQQISNTRSHLVIQEYKS